MSAPSASLPSTPAGHAGSAPSPWVTRWAARWPAGARVLDVACGSGRHTRWCAAQGHRVTAVDRDAAAIDSLRSVAAEALVADLEAGPWPLAERRFDAVVVTNYLWRPLMPELIASVAPGGWLVYETFAVGNESVGKPSNPNFLLRREELFDTVRRELRVVAWEDGFLEGPARYVQRIAAVREAAGATSAGGGAPRYPL